MKKQPSKKANKNCKYIDKANKKTDAARKITSVNIAVLAIAAAAIAVYIIVAPGSEYSQIEQRRSKEFPKFSIAALLKGDFTTRLSEYYVDTVPLRDNFKKIAGRFTALKGVKGKHGSVIIDTGALSDNTPEATFDIENIVVPPARTPRPIIPH